MLSFRISPSLSWTGSKSLIMSTTCWSMPDAEGRWCAQDHTMFKAFPSLQFSKDRQGTLSFRVSSTFPWVSGISSLNYMCRSAWKSTVVSQKCTMFCHIPSFQLSERRRDQDIPETEGDSSQPQLAFRLPRTVPVPHACLRSQVVKMSRTASCSLRSVNLSPAMTIAIAA
jgi:hypothetical protein